MAVFNNEEAQILLKEAFKRFLVEQIGAIEAKPSIELKAWNLALLELAKEIHSYQLRLENGSKDFQ